MCVLSFNEVTQEVESTDFDCGISSINEYIRESYYPLLTQQAYSYSIMAKGKVLGYYQTLFRDIELDLLPDDYSGYDSGLKDGMLSAVHIRFLAIDKRFQGNKIGTMVMETIIKHVWELANSWPIRIITIDARLELIEWYSSLGFVKMLSNSPGQDGVSQLMFFNCMKYCDELENYIDGLV